MHKISDAVRSTHSLEGAVVLDIRHGRIFNLNLAGSRILELVKSGQGESEIVEAVRSEFGIDMETAETDVREFLQLLRKHELIEEPAASDAGFSRKGG